jgi:hypothetical protein
MEDGFVNSFDPHKSAQKWTPKKDWLEWLCSVVVRIIPLDGCIFLPVVCVYINTN